MTDDMITEITEKTSEEAIEVAVAPSLRHRIGIVGPSVLAPGGESQLFGKADASGPVRYLESEHPSIRLLRITSLRTVGLELPETPSGIEDLLATKADVRARDGEWIILYVRNDGEEARLPRAFVHVDAEPRSAAAGAEPRVSRTAATLPPVEAGETVRILLGRHLVPDLIAFVERGAVVPSVRKAAVTTQLEKRTALAVGSHGGEIAFEIGDGHVKAILRTIRTSAPLAISEEDRAGIAAAIRAGLEPSAEKTPSHPLPSAKHAVKAAGTEIDLLRKTIELLRAQKQDLEAEIAMLRALMREESTQKLPDQESRPEVVT